MRAPKELGKLPKLLNVWCSQLCTGVKQCYESDCWYLIESYTSHYKIFSLPKVHKWILFVDMWLSLISLLRIYCRHQNFGTKAWLLLLLLYHFIGCSAGVSVPNIKWPYVMYLFLWGLLYSLWFLIEVEEEEPKKILTDASGDHWLNFLNTWLVID